MWTCRFKGLRPVGAHARGQHVIFRQLKIPFPRPKQLIGKMDRLQRSRSRLRIPKSHDIVQALVLGGQFHQMHFPVTPVPFGFYP